MSKVDENSAWLKTFQFYPVAYLYYSGETLSSTASAANLQYGECVVVNISSYCWITADCVVLRRIRADWVLVGHATFVCTAPSSREGR